MEKKNTEFKESYTLSGNTELHYNELPLKKGEKKCYPGEINGIPCVIFRRKSYRTVLKYLMKQYTMLENYDYEDFEYAPSIFDCFVKNNRAYKFEIMVEDEKHSLIAILDMAPWETADHDLYYLLNLIHYCDDAQSNPDGVFMDDYGLC